jgi:hypothetical protein
VAWNKTMTDPPQQGRQKHGAKKSAAQIMNEMGRDPKAGLEIYVNLPNRQAYCNSTGKDFEAPVAKAHPNPMMQNNAGITVYGSILPPSSNNWAAIVG